jgi:hypothetical protein
VEAGVALDPFAVVGERGSAPEDFDALFASVAADPQGALDGVRDAQNMPLADEPERVRNDLRVASARKLSRRRLILSSRIANVEPRRPACA